MGPRKIGKELFDQAQPLSFLMTKATGIDSEYNNNLAIHIDGEWANAGIKLK